MAKKLLVFGATGQLAHEIGELGKATDSFDITCLSRQQADLSAPDTLPAVIDAHRPEAVIIAAAYTAVDKAESEEALATTINGEAPGVIARHCTTLGLPLLHVSTDYVFDGSKDGAYVEADPVNPIGAYGRSKLAGEQAIQAACAEHIILRTAWVYSAHGANFVKTMLRLGAERDQLKIVADQHGIPTAAADLAAACLDATRQVLTYNRTDAWGIYHYSGAGPTTWFGFADEIFSQAAEYWGRRPAIGPQATEDYPTPAARPKNSVLDCSKIADTFGIVAKPWAQSLQPVIARLLSEQHQAS